MHGYYTCMHGCVSGSTLVTQHIQNPHMLIKSTLHEQTVETCMEADVDLLVAFSVCF